MSEVINGTQTITVPAGDVAADLQRCINRATHDAYQEGYVQGVKAVEDSAAALRELAAIIHDAIHGDGDRDDIMTWPPAYLEAARRMIAAGYRKVTK